MSKFLFLHSQSILLCMLSPGQPPGRALSGETGFYLIHRLPHLMACSRSVSLPLCLSERYRSFLTLPSLLCSVMFLLVTFCGIIFLLATSFPCYTSVDFPPITVFCCSSGVILPVVSLMSSSRGYVPISSSSSECSSSSSSESLTHLTTVASPVLSPSTVSPIS